MNPSPNNEKNALPKLNINIKEDNNKMKEPFLQKNDMMYQSYFQNNNKFTSHKKPKILTETKNTQIHFKPINDNNIKSLSPKDIDKKQANTFNKVNSLQNFSFANASPIINNDNDSKENKDIINKKEEKEDTKEIKIEKKIKKEKFEKLKKEVEDEKIPTFSSINSSSSNNSTTNLKIKPKTKLKSTNSKKKSKKERKES